MDQADQIKHKMEQDLEEDQAVQQASTGAERLQAWDEYETVFASLLNNT